MGAKSSHFLQSDRPESGGSDKKGIREKNGLLERNKEQFASHEKEEKEGFGMAKEGDGAQGGPGGNQGS